MIDHFKTISGPSEGLFKDRGSKFFAYAYPISSEEDVQDCLEILRKTHPKARHHCYAYRIGVTENNFRANDDGEPSGTAGKPILGQLKSFEVTNVLIVVVRYFGGTLLGASGLINAYKMGAHEALSNGEIITQIIENRYLLTFDYLIMSNVMNTIKKMNVKVLKQEFEAEGKIEIALRLSEEAQTLRNLKAGIGNLHIETVTDKTKVEHLTIELL